MVNTTDTGYEIISRSPEETQRLGRLIGEWASPGDIYLLVGTLGAGKTCLTQGIAWGLNIKEYTLSPTFVLVREYYGRLPLYHIDLYRLDGTSDFEDIGLDELLYDQAVIAIEWADKMSQGPFAEQLSITFEIIDNHSRRISLIGYGHQVVNLISTLEFSLD